MQTISWFQKSISTLLVGALLFVSNSVIANDVSTKPTFDVYIEAIKIEALTKGYSSDIINRLNKII